MNELAKYSINESQNSYNNLYFGYIGKVFACKIVRMSQNYLYLIKNKKTELKYEI